MRGFCILRISLPHVSFNLAREELFQLITQNAFRINFCGSGTCGMLSYLEQDVAEPLPQSRVLVPNQPHSLHGAALLEVASQSQLIDL